MKDRYFVEEEYKLAASGVNLTALCFYDSVTNTQFSCHDAIRLLNKLSEKAMHNGGIVAMNKNPETINLTLNFYGSDMTLDKVMGIIERTTREILQ